MSESQEFCARCGGKTWHDSRGCMRCRMTSDVDHVEQRSRVRRRNRSALWVGGLALVAAFVASGFFHCVHSDDIAIKVIPKTHWGFDHQLVNLDEIREHDWRSDASLRDVVDALLRAELLP